MLAIELIQILVVRILEDVEVVNQIELLVAYLCDVVHYWSTCKLSGSSLLQLQDLHVLLVFDSALPDLDGAIVKSYEHSSNRVSIWEMDTGHTHEVLFVILRVCLLKVAQVFTFVDSSIEIDVQSLMAFVLLLPQDILLADIIDPAVRSLDSVLSLGSQSGEEHGAVVGAEHEVEVVVGVEPTGQLLAPHHRDLEHVVNRETVVGDSLDDSIAEPYEPLQPLAAALAADHEHHVAVVLKVGLEGAHLVQVLGRVQLQFLRLLATASCDQVLVLWVELQEGDGLAAVVVACDELDDDLLSVVEVDVVDAAGLSSDETLLVLLVEAHGDDG